MTETLATALRATSGVVAVVGAGGKKSTLYRLAERSDGVATGRSDGVAAERTGGAAAERTVLTATVRIPIFDDHVDSVAVTDDPISTVRSADRWPLGVVPARDRSDRYRGYDPEAVDALGEADVADRILVKADGARTREFKAPGDREPQIPSSADVVVPVASVHAVGHPLTEDTVHRPDRVADLVGRDPGEVIDARDVARVLASDRGGLKGVPDGAAVVPVLNKVDGPAHRETALAIATGLLDRTDRVSRVVLTQLTADEPVVEVVD